MAVITISEGIKQEIAERVAEQASAGYNYDVQGEWYVVNGSAVVHQEKTAQWNNWNDDDNVIAVDDLVAIYGGADDDHADFENGVDGADDFDLTVEFVLGYVPSEYDADDYAARWTDERNIIDPDEEYA